MTIEASTSVAADNDHSLALGSTSDEIGEVLRWLVQSGLIGVRQYDLNSPSSQVRYFDGYAAANMHDHPDIEGTCGLAELAFVANGHYVRTRHNDYYHMKSAPGAFLNRTFVGPPPVPATVLAKATGLNTNGTLDLVGDTQAKWMSEIWANPDRLRVDLVYLELWLEEITGNVTAVDAATSRRHGIYSETLIDSFETATLISGAGAKDAKENLADRPVGYTPFDSPLYPHMDRRRWQVNYRISTTPVGDMAPTGTDPVNPPILIGVSNSHTHVLTAQLTPTQYADLRNSVVPFVDLTSTDVGHNHTYRITWNSGTQSLDGVDLNTNHQHAVIIQQGFSGHVPYNEAKARDGIIDSTNRFRLIRDLPLLEKFGGDLDAMIRSRQARFECVDVEAMMEQCYGMEGEGAVLTEDYNYSGVAYSFDDYKDPSIGGAPSLNAARYNRRSIINRSDASGRQVFHRGFNDPRLFVAKTTHSEVVNGFSYAIPLEVLVRSPVESWNPANITINRATPIPTAAGTLADPFPDARPDNGWYYVPKAIFTVVPGATDPADTVAPSKFVRGADLNIYECAAAGVWVHDLAGRRTRIPVYRMAQEGSREAVDLFLVKRMLRQTLGRIISQSTTSTELEWLQDYADDAQLVALRPRSGVTAARPTGLNATTDVGFAYFDTTIGSAVWWNGAAWATAGAGGATPVNVTVTGDGATTVFTVTHNLALTTPFLPSSITVLDPGGNILSGSSYALSAPTANNFTVTFAVAPANAAVHTFRVTA